MSTIGRFVVGCLAGLIALPALAFASPAPTSTRAPHVRSSVAQQWNAHATKLSVASPVWRTAQPAGARNATVTMTSKSAPRWPSPSRSSSTASAAPSTTTARSAQTIGPTNFLAATSTESGFLPPDSMAGVGPSQILVAVNGLVRSFNKTGTADGAINESLNTFFGVNQSASGTYTSDPRVRYDRFSGRWFVSAIDVPTSGTDNHILVAVSAGSTVSSTGWYIFAIQADSGTLLDFDTLGVDQQALYIGANVFSGSSANTNAYVVDKASAINQAAQYYEVQSLIDVQNGVGPLSPAGVDDFDAGATAGYFIGNDAFTNGQLDLLRITNPLAANPTFDGFVIPTNPTANPIAVQQPSPGPGLDAIDQRVSNAVVRNGQLWTSQSIGVGSAGTSTGTIDRDAVRWYELNNLTSTSTPVVAQSGTVFDSAASAPFNYWTPSVMVSGQGHTALGFSRASTDATSGFASVATAGRLATDPLGTLGAPLVAQASTSQYHPTSNNPERWGDFSNTTVDPADDMTMWTVQEYASSTNVWGVQVVQLVAPAPTVTSATAPHAGLRTTPVTVTGTGFFDPGTGFPKRLTATASGGVVVNNVTSVTPTQVVLDVSTANAAPGAQTLQIMNPDGQTASGAFTVAGPLPCLTCSDFNLDGHPDILYWNKTTGTTVVWFLGGTNGVVKQSGAGITPNGGFPSTSWVPVGSADFNGDGHPDILYWNKTTGTTVVWFMGGTNGVVKQSGAGITPNGSFPSTSWVPVATADFNGDGHPDILYWNKITGHTVVWFMGGTNGIVKQSGAGITPNGSFPSTSWVPVASADFNGDGQSDILYWNNTSGHTVVWFMGGTNGIVKQSGAGITPNGSFPSTSWLPVATPDFNVDGKPDILYWNKTTGHTAAWFMDGIVKQGGEAIVTDSGGFPSTSWVPVV